MLSQGREKTFTELNRLDLKDFLAALNVGFHKEYYFIEYSSGLVSSQAVNSVLNNIKAFRRGKLQTHER